MSAIAKKKVVIIGAGYAGASTAKALDSFAHPEKGIIELTVVTKREGFLLNKISAVRGVVAGDNWYVS